MKAYLQENKRITLKEGQGSKNNMNTTVHSIHRSFKQYKGIFFLQKNIGMVNVDMTRVNTEVGVPWS